MKRYWIHFLLCLVTVAALCLPVSVMAVEPYDPQTQGIVSDYYAIDREQGFITGIAPGTSLQRLLSVCAPKGITASTETLCTGTVLTYGDASLQAAVTADLNGDGAVTISDLLMLKSAILGKELQPLTAAAADANYDGKVSVSDFLKVKSVLLGQQNITQCPDVREQLLLLAPGQTLSWKPTAAAWKTDDAAIVTVDETGELTAVAEGAAFVYAMDADGQLLSRQLITVCSEPLQLTLSETDCRVVKGSSKTITAQLNHPVAADIIWTSSDSAIATVENGIITGVSYGSATVMAMLPGGGYAQVQVQVIPAMNSLGFEHKMYKVKPGNTKQTVLITDPADCEEELVYSTSDATIATVAANGTVTGHKYGTVTLTATGKYSGIQASCQVKVCDVKQVAFTFDDGPSQQTARLLDFLKENDIKVTFFLVGNRVGYYTDTVKRQVAEGHEMGYHSFAHDNQKTLTAEKIRGDFEHSNNKLKELTGQGYVLWRAPGGNINEKVLSSVPLPHIMWSWDSRDWQVRNADMVYANVRNARDGDVVLMHDLYGFTVDGAIRAMKEMQAGDYEFLTVSQLFAAKGIPLKNGANYYKAVK